VLYNRYIPQADGSYQRNRIHDSTPGGPEPKPEIPPCAPAPDSPQLKCDFTGSHSSIQSFLKRLIPTDLDTGDLLIILLLLLMAGDKEDSMQTALLTLALYFFM
jgi:hypothetical protein